VWLVDADPQGSALTAATVRAEAGRTPVLACSQYTTASTLGIQVRRQAAKYDDVVIDVGARDTETLRLALVLADTVLVPVQPRGLDVWALGQVSALVETANASRGGGLRALAVLNLADSGPSPDNTDAAAALAEFPALQLIDAPVRRRKAFASAAAHGLAIDELTPIDLKACQELSNLAEIVFNDDSNRTEP
jgi:chromosome partitioning protein